MIEFADVLDFKMFKKLRKMRDEDTMTVSELSTEFWEIQESLEKHGQEFAESFDGQVLCARQRVLDDKHMELTSESLCGRN